MPPGAGGHGLGCAGARGAAQYRGRLNQADAWLLTIDVRMMPAMASEIRPPKVAEPPKEILPLDPEKLILEWPHAVDRLIHEVV